MKKIVNGNPDLNKAIEPDVQLSDPSDTGLNFIDKKIDQQFKLLWINN